MTLNLATESARIGDAIRAELFKVVRRRMTYILLLSLAALVLLFYVLLWYRIYEGPRRPRGHSLSEWLSLKETMAFASVVPYGLGLERFFATVICVIFAGTMMGNEYDWRTVAAVTARGVRRWHFLLAKLVISLLFVVVAVTATFLVEMAASAWFSHVYDLPYGEFGLHRFVTAAESLGRTMFVVVPFVFLALVCATVWRSAGQAVGAALGVYFTESIFTGLLTTAQGWISHVPEALMNINGDSVMQANGVPPAGGPGGQFLFGAGDAPLWRATLVLATWIAGLTAFAFWRFRRRDIGE